MALRIVCMCGYVIQGDDDDELWRNAQGHMGVLHPELVESVTREDLLAQAEQLSPSALRSSSRRWTACRMGLGAIPSSSRSRTRSRS
jgi:predicted small metal-binding protein